jgi:hypothetical protein
MYPAKKMDYTIFPNLSQLAPMQGRSLQGPGFELLKYTHRDWGHNAT